jgi:hypothetical protein
MYLVEKVDVYDQFYSKRSDCSDFPATSSALQRIERIEPVLNCLYTYHGISIIRVVSIIQLRLSMCLFPRGAPSMCYNRSESAKI